MKRAIVIGINYTGEPYALPDCEQDADTMAVMLKKQGVETFVQKGECSPSWLISHLTVTAAARQTAKDTLYIYFSGHGTQIGDSEAICLYRKTRGIEVLKDKDLRAALDKIEGAKIVILDSCFSGGMDKRLRSGADRPKFIPFDEDTMDAYEAPDTLHRDAKAASAKLYFLFACQKNQVAYSTGIGGRFTNGIRAAAAHGKRTIKTVMSAAVDACEPDQTPKTVIVGGNNQKRVF